jgi:hypothetical protein
MRLPSNVAPPDLVYTTLHGSPLLRPFRLAYRNPAYLIFSLPRSR